MHLVLSVADPADLEPLFDWLDGDAEVAVRKHATAPRPCELGALTDALVVSVSGGGALTVLAATLRGFFRQPRRSKVKISVRRDADRVRGADVEAMPARILDKG